MKTSKRKSHEVSLVKYAFFKIVWEEFMSDPMYFNIEIGGNLKEKLIPGLLETLVDFDEITGPAEVVNFKGWKPKKLEWTACSDYGECDDLKRFLINNKLSFIHTCSSNGVYDGSISYWTPDMKLVNQLKADVDGQAVLDVDGVRPLVDFLFAYIESGEKAFPLFIDSKLCVIREVVSQGLKNRRVKVVQRLKKYVEGLMPCIPELPLFRVI